MTEVNRRILELIKKGFLLSDISKKFNLSNRQIMDRVNSIQASGYNFSRKFFYNGNIKYNIQNYGLESNLSNARIIMDNRTNQFKALVISDLHIGSSESYKKSLYCIYDYCKRAGINIVFNLGDLLNGVITGKKNMEISSYVEQLNEALEKYPYDDNILNFLILGNHDKEFLTNDGLDVSNVINRKRHDINCLGYDQGTVEILDDSIELIHNKKELLSKNFLSSILLSGHSHFYNVGLEYNYLSITAPAFSSIETGYLERLYTPGALELEIDIDNGKFKDVRINQLMVVNNQLKKCGMVTYNIGFFNNKKSPKIKEEDVILLNGEEYLVLKRKLDKLICVKYFSNIEKYEGENAEYIILNEKDVCKSDSQCYPNYYDKIYNKVKESHKNILDNKIEIGSIVMMDEQLFYVFSKKNEVLKSYIIQDKEDKILDFIVINNKKYYTDYSKYKIKEDEIEKIIVIDKAKEIEIDKVINQKKLFLANQGLQKISFEQGDIVKYSKLAGFKYVIVKSKDNFSDCISLNDFFNKRYNLLKMDNTDLEYDSKINKKQLKILQRKFK